MSCDETETGDLKIGVKLAPYNPTNLDAISLALDMISIRSGDTVYDLGCGDGRFLIAACQRLASDDANVSISGVGVEYDYDVYKRACDNVLAHNLTSKIRILHDNVLNISFDDATVLFIYLVPEGILKLKDSLVAALDRGVRIVTYVFSIPGLTPNQVAVYKGSTKLYLYKRANDQGITNSI